jgi:phosphoribosylaminoimidazolecarboxamide formyltransferase/IMP cyclohydrolase
VRALLSVYDKTGIIDLARDLVALGYEIVSTGGTLQAISEAGLPATAVADVTGFPEILDGRVKTLHPAIHAGLLARRADAGHVSELDEHHIVPIDLVAANLYPFAATIAREGVSLLEAIEQIDIGGPAMIRAAAKNFEDVAVVTNPGDYALLVAELRQGPLAEGRRRELAAKAFAHVAAYDTVVADFLRGGSASEFPLEWTVAGRKTQDLRYGENPRQRAVAYRRLAAGPRPLGVLDATHLAGKELSFNNLLDADAAWRAIAGFDGPTVAIVKHTIPCGFAIRDLLADAFDAALAGDPVSAFGGIVALNRVVDGDTARRLSRVFFEVVIAPGFDADARQTLTPKQNLRLLELPPPPGDAEPSTGAWDVRPITGGLLVQDDDDQVDDPREWRVVTRRAPSREERADLGLAWSVVRHVKSNAIVLVREHAVVGVGSGQPNRLESVRIAAMKAGPRAAGAALASDAFFPFADGIEAAAAAGVTAIVQPGGSVRDEEAIAAADAAEIAMLFTGVRHFRH